MATRSFVDADVVIDPEHSQIHLSRIFSWYGDDFGGPTGIIALIRRSLPDDARRTWLEQAGGDQLVYRDYDWRLNTAVR